MTAHVDEICLDRTAREALRRELELCANGSGDFALGFAQAKKTYVHEQLQRLRRVIEAMDAIGWHEQPDAPDRRERGEVPIAGTLGAR